MESLQDLEKTIIFQNAGCSSAADVLVKLGTPTASVAILEKGIISARCFSTQKSDEETLFQACSISKPMAAIATFRAVQAGKISLTTPISDCLSPKHMSLIQSPATAKILQSVTIEMLLSHTSGLTVPGFQGYAKDAPSIDVVLKGVYPSNSMPICLEGLPGQQFSYSGGGYTVLQLILETLFQKSFPDIMQELLFEPLGMNRSFYALAPTEDNYATAFHTGYTPCDHPYHIQPELAAAGLWTTPSDLLRAVHAIQSSLKGTNDGFLQLKWARLMLSEVQSAMARGWVAPKGRGVFSHGGANDPGYRCYLLGYADLEHDNAKAAAATECGICVMTNSAHGFDICLKILTAVIHRKKWPALPPKHSAFVPFMSSAPLDERWKEWIGKWSDDWEVLIEERHPILKFRDLAPMRLCAASMPAETYSEGSSIDLVVEGLEMMLRLGWEEGKRMVEVWQGGIIKLEQKK